jgi:hypothetical protein
MCGSVGCGHAVMGVCYCIVRGELSIMMMIYIMVIFLVVAKINIP